MINSEEAVDHHALASLAIILRLTWRGKRKRPTGLLNRSGAKIHQACSTQGQIAHLPFPFTFQAAFSQQQDIFNGNASWNIASNLENTRH